MKRLVIHPEDSSTAFLKPVYEGRDDTTVVTGGCPRGRLMEMINDHSQVILMGHGTGYGLLSAAQFEDVGGYVIDDTFAPLLGEKDDVVFIWCHANKYVQRNKLNGFYTGMFISELYEAYLCGLWPAGGDEIDESNRAFVSTVSKFVDSGATLMHAAARHEYGRFAIENEIAAYNHRRLYAS